MAAIMSLWRRWKIWWLSGIAGAVLGCIYRLVLDFGSPRLGSLPLVMTLGFLAVVPLCMGYVAVNGYLRNAPADRVSLSNWLFLPWSSVLITMAVSVVVKWEGYICLLFAAPIMLVMSMLGGLIAGGIWKEQNRRSPGTISVVALPLLLILLEAHMALPLQIRTVETGILVHAPASVVWDNIKSVRAIEPRELPESWVTKIGFPKPIAATLSHDGIGGVRKASFTGGLVFTETVNGWDPESDLRFSIHANTDSVPPSTLDEHVTVGGAFFDVLDGEYLLDQRSNGVMLRLRSHERLSTHLNPYASLWTDAVMRSIQNQILAVIRERCENQPAKDGNTIHQGAIGQLPSQIHRLSSLRSGRAK